MLKKNLMKKSGVVEVNFDQRLEEVFNSKKGKTSENEPFDDEKVMEKRINMSKKI